MTTPEPWQPDARPLGGEPFMRPVSQTIRLALERTATDRWVWTEFAWTGCIGVAEAAAGYKPAGTLAPDAGWDGRPYDVEAHGAWPLMSYAPAMGQRMTARDAHALADAFDRMIAKIETGRLSDAPVDAETVRSFAKFLHRGAFSITPVDPPFARESWESPVEVPA